MPKRLTDTDFLTGLVDGKAMLKSVMRVLRSEGSISDTPPDPVALGLPAYMSRDNIIGFEIEKVQGGYVPNINFKNVPAGAGDQLGGSETTPLPTAQAALQAGMALLLYVQNGSPHLRAAQKSI